MFIQLDRVAVTYPNGVRALRQTEIGFAPRDLTVILGRSGAGKSTLLRTLNMLVAPTNGRVMVDGVGCLDDRAALRAHRRGTAMIFQQHQLLSRMTSLQNVLTSRLPRYSWWRSLLPMPESEKRWALECLDRVGLLDKALERCDALSGGQQQRVGIARALAQEPRLILADEPVASVDPAAAEHILRTLRDICRQDGIPAIVSLHQLELAKAFADRIVGLADGGVVFDGPPHALSDRNLFEIYGTMSEAKAEPRRRAESAEDSSLVDLPQQMESIG
ncbi:MAG: phosphonate ABC transporter ATP-binding protein [Alphaproteobacteria bacterium]|nr:phosphonate ABC transporter ATP-binding protein [Alphaproteobacteria bacterium]